MIELQPFNENDFNRLIAEVPDARFLLQWAGPKYTYPLDVAQLSATLADTRGDKPGFQMFKAVNSDTSETVGHIQFMNLDYDAKSCFIGRVLIFQKYRGKGFGKEMMEQAVRRAFENLKLNELCLGVFDFNTSAIGLYEKIGFRAFEFLEGARQLQDEKWNLIRMKLNKGSDFKTSP